MPDYNSNGRRCETEGWMEEGAELKVRMEKGAGLNIGWTELPDGRQDAMRCRTEGRMKGGASLMAILKDVMD